MKIKLGQLEVVALSLGKMLTEKIPVSTRFLIKRIFAVVEPELRNYNENRLELCRKYCLRDEHNQPIIENGSYKFEDENSQKFADEMKELTSTEIELNIEPFTSKQFGNAETGPEFEALIDLGIVTE